TLKQMYTGSADWEAIGRAAELIHQTSTLALGNGDLTSLAMAAEKIALSGVDGVLIGRGAMGNPWIFGHKEELKDFLEGRRKAPPADRFPDLETRFAVLLEHARLFEAVKGHARFAAMRKHFAFYCKGMPRAAELRNRMFQTKDSGEVERIIVDYLAGCRPEEEVLPCAVSS
ncbi:MAG TPA: tRNA-dihydrouridine synthase, partial [bacterium]|nr:tRNA-dihydrouridine synthase [bacterium]